MTAHQSTTRRTQDEPDGGPVLDAADRVAVRELAERAGLIPARPAATHRAGRECNAPAPETAETLATRALAARGIAAHRDEDAGNTWLVIGRDQTRQGFPCLLADPFVVLYLHSETDEEEVTVDRAPAGGDHWDVIAGDSKYALTTRPADQLAECVEAIADWLSLPEG